VTRREFEIGTGSSWPKRKGFRNFTWTTEAICEWEDAWNALWRIGIKWEWQNSDRYARSRGEIYNLFAVHNDADRLDMAIPLPGREIILEMHEYLHCINVILAIILLAACLTYVAINSILMTSVINTLRLDTYITVDTGFSIVMLVLLLVWAPVWLIRSMRSAARYTGRL